MQSEDTMTRKATGFGIALVLCGISSGAAAQGTRDSAGVQIVDNAKPAWAAGREWRLAEKPVAILGEGKNADDHFGRIVGLTRLSDGRIVVADQSTLQLKYFDASGRHLTSVGGKGPGANEFRNFNAIARLAGDSVVVDAPEKSSIFAPSGVFVRSIPYAFAATTFEAPFVWTMGHFDNGTAVVGDYPQGKHGPAGARQWIDSSSLYLVDRSGSVIRPLGKAPVVMFVAEKPNARPVDFGPQAVYASAGNALYMGFTNEYAVRVYDNQWKLRRIVRRAWTPRRFTERDIDEYVDGWMAMWSSKTGAERDAERKEMRANTYPEFLAPYSAIITTAAGEMWLREPDLTGAPGCWCLAGVPTVPSTWSVFDANGRWLGDVSMPPRFVPLEIGADYVLGRSREADKVPRVVMYRLEKPR